MSVCLSVNFFSVKDFSATTWVRILKFGTKLDSDELYWVTKNNYIFHTVSLFVHFTFSPMEISVIDFSAPIKASVLKFCVHPQVGKVYCVNGNEDANPHFAFFLHFFYLFLLSFLYNIFSVNDFSAITWVRILKFGTKLDSDELYCVTKTTATYLLIIPFISLFSFSPM